MTHVSIGERIRMLRKVRHLTVRQLAAAARISPSSLEKYESGDRNVVPSVLTALASALSVGPEVLTGQPYYNSAEADERIQATIPDLRRVLATYDSPDALPSAPRPLEVLAAETERVSLMRQNARYASMGSLLPGLLTELTHTALDGRGEQQQRAYWWLARGYRAANSLAHKLGHHDLSNTALERFRWAADRSGDQNMQVTAGYLRAGALVRLGAFDSARRVLEGLVGEIDRFAPEGSLTDAQIALRGAVLLKLAMVEARDGGARTGDLLDEADLIAALNGGRDTDLYEMAFGPTNVRIHRIAALIDEGDAEQALARLTEWGADQDQSEWVLPGDIAAERSSHHHIDVAGAKLAQADAAGAFASLQVARSLAPVHVRFHPTVRQTTAALVRADRTGSEELASFARWAGVQS
ncbi:helix-turn-helix domain-containing protein [Streptacidiphilus sp. N1-12]|uniref:Helix-turn-helix domain-containing protein n=2 Tax=Streptacidiphilus alkalitolerans TaxID=3342712 RepID=A0ABV6WEF3_9ACTN